MNIIGEGGPLISWHGGTTYSATDCPRGPYKVDVDGPGGPLIIMWGTINFIV